MGPPLLTAQTSSRPLPHTLTRISVVGRLVSPAVVTHDVPFQCRMVPPSPTIQTSFGPLPHTPVRDRTVRSTAGDQLVPFQCRIRPPVAAAHASLGPLPQTARMRSLSPAIFARLAQAPPLP